jgi:hypothetical protein
MAKEPFGTGEEGATKSDIEKINVLLFAVVVVLLFMVGNMLIDSWNNKSASLENFSSQINQQNIQLQKLNDKLDKK